MDKVIKKGDQTMAAKKTTILVADDDMQLLRLIERNLLLEGYHVLIAQNGQDTLKKVSNGHPDLLLLDVMMPNMDGFTVCQEIRRFSATPIILITARDRESDKIKGLNMGADDYLTKPFNVIELLARIRAVLRRSQFTMHEPAYALQSKTTIGDIKIDFALRTILVEGKTIELTPTEYRILLYLIQNANRVIPYDVLLNHVWGAEYIGEVHMLQVNVNRLRHKVEGDPSHPRYIHNKMGIGYFFTCDAMTK